MVEIAKDLRDALVGRYALDREIGRGGMAVVYRVRDHRHERWVALKALRPELSATLGAERFLREIRLAAGLQHPHILPLHDSGEAAGLLYYVMPYVEGESLRARLDRERQLPLEDALRITREVASALQHAHSRGIVHRDVKPENLLLSDGHALVADFGIARAIHEAGGLALTETGLAVGTPAYMSPEQASGDPVVDGRADIYALGCVLYEMLAGEQPFRGPTAQGVMSQHSLSPVPSIRNARPSVPEEIERAITRALAKNPADRFTTAQAFAAALPPSTTTDHVVVRPGSRRASRMAGVLASVLLVSAAAWAGARRWTAETRDAPISIAVAPMLNRADTSLAYLADGMTQELTSALTRVPGVEPRPYATVVGLAKEALDPVALGQRLGVEYVLASTLRRISGEITLATEVVRVRDGTNVWSPHTFRGSVEDLLGMQDSLTSRIVGDLAGEIAPRVVAAGVAGQGRRDPEAYQLYLQARRVAVVSALGSQQAVELLSRAIERDSSFADAWAALAWAYSNWAQYSGDPPGELLRRKADAANRAVTLDSLNAPGLVVLGWTSFTEGWDYDRADGEFRRAIEATPNDAGTHIEYAKMLQQLGITDSALAETRRAIRLDPTNSHFVMIYGWQHQAAGRYREADSLSRRALELDPTNWVAYIMLAKTALREGRNADAIKACDEGARVEGLANPFMLAFAGQCYGRAGQPEKARTILATLTQMSRERYVQRAQFAWLRIGLGDRSGALDDLELAANSREVDFQLAMHESAQDLWNDPRYQALLRRTKLDRYWKRAPVS